MPYGNERTTQKTKYSTTLIGYCNSAQIEYNAILQKLNFQMNQKKFVSLFGLITGCASTALVLATGGLALVPIVLASGTVVIISLNGDDGIVFGTQTILEMQTMLDLIVKLRGYLQDDNIDEIQLMKYLDDIYINLTKYLK
ncbi:hypothetical protein DLAC_08257 [Tieghemostelium lacteum]|uniref:Uncharacterized protein n=1 Tax=Tieghemostelium lacteum TaxID=361077 RepID=A0A151ZBJ8_TIELA|nr:hypothetical protein DLAC_08257 [Tieghemostelium lacteum]|eukprot:KYQ91311.1 hypothetical protein DLAC_08257 [Tieghemostelium lacteum]